jgi:hypothetical protein
MPFTFEGKRRLVDFKMTCTSSVLTFTYPQTHGTYTSLYWDNQLDVEELDYAAVRAVVPGIFTNFSI